MPVTDPTVDPLRGLGVRAPPSGGELRVWSANATAIELCIYGSKDPHWVAESIPLQKDNHDVWSGTSPALVAGTRYSLRASGPSGPTHMFDPNLHLIDP